MTRDEILIEVEHELARLLQVRRLLTESAKSLKKIERITGPKLAAANKNSLKDSASAKTAKKKRQLSAEGRHRIILGQKKRRARQRAEEKIVRRNLLVSGLTLNAAQPTAQSLNHPVRHNHRNQQENSGDSRCGPRMLRDQPA